MKSENGITLVTLVTIIIILIITASLAVYTGMSSYRATEIQKYKSQMQMIQNEVDKIYEENKNNELKNNPNDPSYSQYKVSEREEEAEGFWQKEIANDKFGIDINNKKEEYYCFSAEEIEKEFDLKDIDISEYFIINFQKRYVFSVTPIEVIVSVNEDGTENKEEIYCLYQLDEEEKIVEFKSDGNFEYNIYKEDYKQTIEIIHDVNIEKVEAEVNGEYVDVRERKDYCTKISGLNTEKITLEIIKNCNIKITDVLGNENEKEIQLYNIPVLEKNMIPIIPVLIIKDEKEVIKGKICSTNDPEWYNYYIKDGGIYIDETNFAVAINANTTNPSDTTNPSNTTYNNYYKANVSDTVNTIVNIPTSTDNEPVKVWIPKNLVYQVNNTYGTTYKEQYFEGTGMWVEATWDTYNKKYVPANGN